VVASSAAFESASDDEDEDAVFLGTGANAATQNRVAAGLPLPTVAPDVATFLRDYPMSADQRAFAQLMAGTIASSQVVSMAQYTDTLSKAFTALQPKPPAEDKPPDCQLQELLCRPIVGSQFSRAAFLIRVKASHSRLLDETSPLHVIVRSRKDLTDALNDLLLTLHASDDPTDRIDVSAIVHLLASIKRGSALSDWKWVAVWVTLQMAEYIKSPNPQLFHLKSPTDDLSEFLPEGVPLKVRFLLFSFRLPLHLFFVSFTTVGCCQTVIVASDDSAPASHGGRGSVRAPGGGGSASLQLTRKLVILAPIDPDI